MSLLMPRITSSLGKISSSLLLRSNINKPRSSSSNIVSKMSSSSIIESIANDARPSQKSRSILDTIGKTPLVKLSNKMAPEGVNVYVKCEAFNPMGSVKDRLALGCIEVRDAKNKNMHMCIISQLRIIISINVYHSGQRKMDISSQVKQ